MLRLFSAAATTTTTTRKRTPARSRFSSSFFSLFSLLSVDFRASSSSSFSVRAFRSRIRTTNRRRFASLLLFLSSLTSSRCYLYIFFCVVAASLLRREDKQYTQKSEVCFSSFLLLYDALFHPKTESSKRERCLLSPLSFSLFRCSSLLENV